MHLPKYPIVALALAIALVPAISSAITVKKAQIKNGALEVRGKEATPGATITLDGVSSSAVASGSGSYKASAVVLPSDCIVTVGDGVATVDAVVKNRGPQGEPSAFNLLDANDNLIGAVVGVGNAQSGDAVAYEVDIESVGKLLTILVQPLEDGPVSGLADADLKGKAVWYSGAACSGQAYINLSQSDENHVQNLAGTDRFFVPAAFVPSPVARRDTIRAQRLQQQPARYTRRDLDGHRGNNAVPRTDRATAAVGADAVSSTRRK
jgi:hypothetical protein